MRKTTTATQRANAVSFGVRRLAAAFLALGVTAFLSATVASAANNPSSAPTTAGAASPSTTTSAVATPASASLRVVGSDLFGAPVKDALTAFATSEHAAIDVSLKGSLPAREALVAGRADAALLADVPDDGGDATISTAGFRKIPVAFLAVVIAVNNENPATQATFAQLAGMFGPDATLTARRWGDLGLGDDWTARAISPVALSHERSIATDFFGSAVLGGRPLRATVAQLDDVRSVLERASSDRGVVALLPVLPPSNGGARALLVARNSSDVAFGPSPENIASGDYPLRLPLVLVFRAGSENAVAPLARFFASSEAAAAIEKSLLVPLPAGARSRLATEFAGR
jgi:phosphate transport system substrate-binding protein